MKANRNGNTMTQMSMFDGANEFVIDKPIRLIELFAGYGSQHLALNYLGAKFESWHICEWAVKSIQAYKDLHCADDNTDYSEALTFDEVVAFLFGKGISANYNEPMTEEQIRRMGEKKCRQVYNNIIASKNLVSVTQTHAKDLEIVDTDKYCYVLTYSFPCQDLSKAGKQKGMAKGSGTRSGMLWEVERILDECENLPQVLVMENVPDVIGTKNIHHFAEWIQKLEKLGYHNYWQVLNGKDQEIPQNRERCFMVSIHGDYYYEFPNPIKLKLRLRDMLETNVDEKFYISDCILLKVANSNFAQEKARLQTGEICGTILARDYKDPKLVAENVDIKCEQVADMTGGKWDKLFEQSRRVYGTNGLSPTLHTTGGGNRVRKLTPRECWRLMGVKDEDYDKVAKNQSNSSLYHLAGDSIITNVLMAIFRQMM